MLTTGHTKFDYQILDDLELIAHLKNGDSNAFTEIYTRHVFVLLNHAYQKTRDREFAKDLIQEVFTMLWSKRETLQINSNVIGFLYTAVRNIILNKVAHQNVRENYISSMLQFANQEHAITDYLVREKQLNSIIEKEIAALPQRMQEVFKLSRNEHLSHREIAEKLDISEQTASKHVSNSLKILRLKLNTLGCLILTALQIFF